MLRTSLALCLCTVLAPTPPPAGAGDADLEARIRAIVGAACEEESIDALTLAIHLGGEWMFAGAFGDAESPDAAFRAGVLGDALVATAVLQLAGEGELDLDARVSILLPGFEVEEPLRLRHLLVQASGLPDLEDLALASGDGPPALDAILAALADAPFEADPGSCVRVTRTNALLLGLVLERADGRPAHEAVTERVLRPAGMDATAYCEEGPALRESAPAAREDSGDLVREAAAQRPFRAALLCSTAMDLVRWQLAIEGGRILGSQEAALLSREALLEDGATSGRCPGFEAVVLGVLHGRSAGGALAGGRAHVAWYGDAALGIAILCDAPLARIDRLERRLARLVLGFDEPEVVDEPLTAEERERYVGSYYVGCSEYRVRDDGRRLVVYPFEGTPFALLYQGGLRFVSAADADVEIEFQERDGVIVGWWLTERGARSEGRRM